MVNVTSNAGNTVANGTLEANQCAHFGDGAVNQAGLQIAGSQLRHIVDRGIKSLQYRATGLHGQDHQ
ncbi:hypothetical protein D3C78_1596410 [compost metagenome]